MNKIMLMAIGLSLAGGSVALAQPYGPDRGPLPAVADQGMRHDDSGMRHDDRGMRHDDKGMRHDDKDMRHDDRGDGVRHHHGAKVCMWRHHQRICHWRHW